MCAISAQPPLRAGMHGMHAWCWLLFFSVCAECVYVSVIGRMRLWIIIYNTTNRHVYGYVYGCGYNVWSISSQCKCYGWQIACKLCVLHMKLCIIVKWNFGLVVELMQCYA